MFRARAVLRLFAVVLSGCILLAGPGASAAPPPLTPTAIAVTIIDDLSPRVAGQPTDFSATLVDDQGHPLPDQTVSLWTRSIDDPSFDQAAQGTTDASGAVTLWVTLDRSAVVEWRYDGKDTYAASAPVDLGVGISPLVTARAHHRIVRSGHRLVVTGWTFPAKAGCRVSLWNGVPRLFSAGPAPKLLARSVARADGSYRLVRRLHKAARMRVAVTVASCAGNDRGFSPGIRIRVR